MNTKLIVLRILGLLLASITLIPIASAATFPEKPVRAIIPWPPGGSTDIVGRRMAAEMDAHLKQRVIIDNRAGAGGIVGMQIVAQSPPDGYTVMITSTAYGHLIYKSKVNVDLVKSFAPVALFGFGESVLVVHPQLPVKSVRELIALAKARPGALNYASSGVGGFLHMNAELFKMKAGVDITHVPFKGGGPALTDTIAGHTQLMITSLISVVPHINSGRLKVLGVGSAKRNPNLPDVPTISEAGVPGYETNIWWGMFAPIGTPPAVIARLHAAVTAALASPELLKRFDEQGAVTAHMSSADFGKLMVSETAKWMGVIKAAGIMED